MKVKLFFILTTVVILIAGAVQASTITVCASGCDHATIQAAVNAAIENDTVSIGLGTYGATSGEVFPITIDKTLLLVGDGLSYGNRPKIEVTAGSLKGFSITADNVTLQNLWLYQSDHPTDAAMISVPWGGVWPTYTIEYDGLTIRDCLVEGGRYGTYLSVGNLTVEQNVFKNTYRSPIITSGTSGTTTIRNNIFLGDLGTYAGRSAIYMTTGSGTPTTSGTVTITGNTCTGKQHFFLFEHWNEPTDLVDLLIQHNSVDTMTGKGVVFYGAPDGGWDKFQSIEVLDNIFANMYPAVYVDWATSTGSEAPADGQIQVHHNLTYQIAVSDYYVMDPSGGYGYNGDAAPAEASLSMFALADNLVANPYFVDPTHANDDWSLESYSSAMSSASDSTNRGAWQDETPIELISFEAESLDDAVLLSWETATEKDNAGFHLYRSDSANGSYERITSDLLPAEGNEFTGASYEFVDSDVEEGTYYYKLEDVDYFGNSSFHGPVEATLENEPQFGCGIF